MFENLSDKPISEVQTAQADRWEQENLLERCVTEREGSPSFVFYEGPPTDVYKRQLQPSLRRDSRSFPGTYLSFR